MILLPECQHQTCLRHALGLAVLGVGGCAPNPAVGALVVRAGQVVGRGWHLGPGQPHAEVMALQAAGELARGATLYVTLEPCHHQGRTPPCTQAICAAGVDTVVYAYRDPNPNVCGGGADFLVAQGLNCLQVALPEIADFYAAYAFWLQTGMPWTTAKLALSADGKIAGVGGQPVLITGAGCQQLTHQERWQADALLTTINTVVVDNPRLNVRLGEQVLAKPVFVIDPLAQLPINVHLLATAAQVIVLHGAAAPKSNLAALVAAGVQPVLIHETTTAGRLSHTAIRRYLGAQGHHRLWLEAGSRCFAAWLTEVQRVLLYISSRTLGEAATPALGLTAEHWAGWRLQSSAWLAQDYVCELLNGRQTGV